MVEPILEGILFGLNTAQRAAVTSSSFGQLQVIAGPGTGKTKVLTSRVAYLMLEHGLAPEDIIVTTFTKKAANEMKERLKRMLQDSGIRIDRLLMGTFHSICVRILRRYGYLIGVKGFKVAAERDTNDVMKSVIAASEDDLKELRELAKRTGNKVDNLGGKKEDEVDFKFVRRQVSSLKSKGLRPFEYKLDQKHSKSLLLLYERYQEKLEVFNLLDFDDLLMITNTLLKKHKVLRSIQYVLIDEFQDTNSIQLDLMRSFSHQNVRNSDNITVVGDPDQSIYAFRDAVPQNFSIMKEVYKNCDTIILDETYRSTKDVLDFSETFMCQQKDRKTKLLKSQYKESFPPVYLQCFSNYEEAEYISNEIALLKKLPGLYKYSEFAILIRAAHLSRVIETVLLKKRIPYMVVKGRAFWERKEVSLMIDFLRVIAHKSDINALMRTLCESTTGIGHKAVQTLTTVLERELRMNSAPLNTLKEFVTGNLTIPRVSKKGVSEFLKVIDTAFQVYDKDKEDKSVILELFDKIKELPVFASLLKDDQERQENIAEVRLQIEEFDPKEEQELFQKGEEGEEGEEEKTKENIDGQPVESYLEKFITSISLFMTVDPNEEKNTEGKVSISTIHAAKGLEWPVVFIPGLLDGILPLFHPGDGGGDHDDSDQLNEERRVFYVAATRAKHLLYISSGPRNGSNQVESSFLDRRVKSMLVQRQKAFKDQVELRKLYSIVGVPASRKKILDVYCRDYQKYHSEMVRQRKDRFISKAHNSIFPSVTPGKNENEIPTHGIHYSNNRYSNKAPSYTLQKSEKRYHTEISTSTVTTIGMNSMHGQFKANKTKFNPHFKSGGIKPGISYNKNTTVNSNSLSAVVPKKRKTLGVRRRVPEQRD